MYDERGRDQFVRETAGARRRQLLPDQPLRSGPHPPTARSRAITRLPNRIISSLVVIALSLSLIVSAAGLDGFLHRGVTYGVAAEGTGVGGARLGMNVFLEKEADRDNVVKSVQMLKEAGVTYVRQSFPWQEIEPNPGERSPAPIRRTEAHPEAPPRVSRGSPPGRTAGLPGARTPHPSPSNRPETPGHAA